MSGIMFIEAMDEFKLSDGTIITDEIVTVEMHSEKSIRFMPLWKWLLDL